MELEEDGHSDGETVLLVMIWMLSVDPFEDVCEAGEGGQSRVR